MSDQGNPRFRLDWERYTRTLLTNWRILALVFIVSLPVGVVVAHTLALRYTATMTVTAARYTSDTKPMSSGSGGSVASLLGSADQGQLSDFALYLKLFDSQLVAERIYKDHPDLVHRIFANQWKGDHWGPPPGMKQRLRTFLYSLVGARTWSPPSTLELASFLGSVSVEPDRRNPIAVVSLKLGDRDLALEILTVLHNETENVLKDEATARSSIKAGFLARMATNSRAVDVSQTVGMAQVRNEISAAVSRAPVPFAAEFISPPTAPLLPNQSGRIYAPVAVASLVTLLTALWLILADYYPGLKFWELLRRRESPNLARQPDRAHF